MLSRGFGAKTESRRVLHLFMQVWHSLVWRILKVWSLNKDCMQDANMRSIERFLNLALRPSWTSWPILAWRRKCSASRRCCPRTVLLAKSKCYNLCRPLEEEPTSCRLDLVCRMYSSWQRRHLIRSRRQFLEFEVWEQLRAPESTSLPAHCRI